MKISFNIKEKRIKVASTTIKRLSEIALLQPCRNSIAFSVLYVKCFFDDTQRVNLNNGGVVLNMDTDKKENKDVFHAYLTKNASYAGEEEIPCIKTSKLLPEKVISFSKALTSSDYDSWIHFYEHDYKFERLWKNPQKYLPIIKKFRGIITPDFSLYYDMPLVMQKWNTYRGKSLAHWLQENGVEVIPNVRWGDERTYALSTLGVEKNKTIAVGTHGCIKTVEEKRMFIRGLDYVVMELNPENIIVYGRMPDKIFCIAKMYGINLVQFESEFAASHKKEVA